MNPPATKSCLVGEEVFTLGEFLSRDECQDLIEFSETQGYEFATVGDETLPTLRNNARVTIVDPDRAEWLWERARPFLPNLDDGRKPTGFNPLIRFYRYDKEQHFDWHSDGIYRNDDGQSSACTFLVYLNDSFEGGETAFYDNRSKAGTNRFEVTPKAGLALCFVHEIFHRSEPMKQGRKYVLRTDVMYDKSA